MKFSTLTKPLIAVTVLCLLTTISLAQKTEIKLNAYGGLFSFRGNGSTNGDNNFSGSYVLFGRKPGFSYSFEMQAQKITKQQHIAGLGVAFERVKSTSKVTLFPTDIFGSGPPPPPMYGQTTLTNSFINVNP